MKIRKKNNRKQKPSLLYYWTDDKPLTTDIKTATKLP